MFSVAGMIYENDKEVISQMWRDVEQVKIYPVFDEYKLKIAYCKQLHMVGTFIGYNSIQYKIEQTQVHNVLCGDKIYEYELTEVGKI